MKLDYCLTPYTKIKTQCVKDLSVIPETIKLLEEYIGNTDCGDFLKSDHKVKGVKINKWVYVILESFWRRR